MRTIRLLFLAALSCAAVFAAEEPTMPAADMTIYAGPVFWTGDPDVPEAAAVAVRPDGRIHEVYAAVPRGLPWPVVTLPGALALPGLHDAHLHVSGIGMAEEQVRLDGCASLAESLERVRAWAAEHPYAGVIRGRGWDQSRWSENRFPNRGDLAEFDDRPVYLRRVDGHAAWVNDVMLELAGVTAATVDPEGGRIHRDEHGRPTGLLIDNAVELVEDVLPDPTPLEIERRLLAGLNACADAGLVAVHDMGQTPEVCAVAERLAAEGRLPIRLFVYLEGSDEGSLEALGRHQTFDRFAVVGMKYYTDGALGSRGAALLEDYSDEPGACGLAVTDPEELDRQVDAVHRRGYQCAIHAIGDRGNRNALDAIHRAQVGETGRRHRIEHAQVVHPDDFARFAAEGVIASMQPTHCTSDMRWVERRIGAERARGAYAWRTFLDLDVVVPLGSDAPVEHWDPLPGVYAAITRQDAAGEPAGGWRPEQRLTVDEALHGFTGAAAYAVHREADLGVLRAGAFFDLTVLDVDPREEPSAWLRARPVHVYVGGERIR